MYWTGFSIDFFYIIIIGECSSVENFGNHAIILLDDTELSFLVFSYIQPLRVLPHWFFKQNETNHLSSTCLRAETFYYCKMIFINGSVHRFSMIIFVYVVFFPFFSALSVRLVIDNMFFMLLNVIINVYLNFVAWKIDKESWTLAVCSLARTKKMGQKKSGCNHEQSICKLMVWSMLFRFQTIQSSLNDNIVWPSQGLHRTLSLGESSRVHIFHFNYVENHITVKNLNSFCNNLSYILFRLENIFSFKLK